MVATLAEFKQAFSVASSPSVAPSQVTSSRRVAQSPAPSPPASKQREKDRLDQVIDQALGDAEKRAKALLTWKVPKFSEDYKKAPELDKYFADLESGIAKVREHVKYVSEVVGYVEKYGNPALLEGTGRLRCRADGNNARMGEVRKDGGAVSGGTPHRESPVRRVGRHSEW
jgi:hypothetical protein